MLVTWDKQQSVKPLSVNNRSKYDQIAKEVESVELRELLGVELSQDLQNNPTSENNVKLLDQHTFKNCKGNNVTHQGLRYVLAYFNYARYVYGSYIDDTFTGFVQKNREETTTLNKGDMKGLQIESRKIAMSEFMLIKEFLNLNKNNYPLWECTDENSIFMPKLTFLRKTAG